MDEGRPNFFMLDLCRFFCCGDFVGPPVVCQSVYLPDYLSVCLCLSFRPSVRKQESKNKKTNVLEACLSGDGSWVGRRMWMKVARPCPPIRTNIVTQRNSLLEKM